MCPVNCFTAYVDLVIYKMVRRSIVLPFNTAVKLLNPALLKTQIFPGTYSSHFNAEYLLKVIK